ncbi:olfactory receptor 1D2-like [Seriola lalandi dorsalis]|uniref:olfactory receptor 1D2-like n=1 Tax=Seriola lalandi dorsalis TaxID=1841481 RepID=UPI000C6F5A6E|nr:olfactory receptor 1D2-like [Seriola lalandi dorsalis]
MNSSRRMDSLNDAFSKNFITFALGFLINCINGAFVYIYFKSEVFQRDPRYVLYIHLVINDMIMLTVSVALQIMIYTIPLNFAPCCIMLLILITTNKNSPLNLAGMAVERYIAVCRPLHHVQMCTVQRAYALIALIWGVSIIPALTDIIIILATQPPSVYSRTVICYPAYLYSTAHHKAQSVVVQMCTVQRAYALIALIWGVSIIPALTDIIIILATQPPSVYSRTVICYPAYLYSTAHHKAQSVVVQTLLFSFVGLTLIITYLKVLCAARAVSGSNKDSARNARNTILLHGVQLLICMLSFISPLITVILLTTWPRERTKILFTTFLFTNVLPRLLSPLIYGVRDKKFSSHIRLHFFCKCCNSVEKKVNPVGPWRRSKQVLQ